MSARGVRVPVWFCSRVRPSRHRFSINKAMKLMFPSGVAGRIADDDDDVADGE